MSILIPIYLSAMESSGLQSLGRVEKSSLSQQTLMELLFDGIKNKNRICGTPEIFETFYRWNGINLDGNNDVYRVLWLGMYLEGSLNLQWLPSSVILFTVFKNDLSGTVDLTSLPGKLEVLALSRNEFEGTIVLTSLPLSMKNLLLDSNKFSGWTDFSSLPPNLEELNVSSTDLEGELSVAEGKRFAANYSLVKIIKC